ncbi:hypothetical protein BKA93DRAFT_387440 [Sparassis latifolia]
MRISSYVVFYCPPDNLRDNSALVPASKQSLKDIMEFLTGKVHEPPFRACPLNIYRSLCYTACRVALLQLEDHDSIDQQGAQSVEMLSDDMSPQDVATSFFQVLQGIWQITAADTMPLDALNAVLNVVKGLFCNAAMDRNPEANAGADRDNDNNGNPLGNDAEGIAHTIIPVLFTEEARTTHTTEASNGSPDHILENEADRNALAYAVAKQYASFLTDVSSKNFPRSFPLEVLGHLIDISTTIIDHFQRPLPTPESSELPKLHLEVLGWKVAYSVLSMVIEANQPESHPGDIEPMTRARLDAVAVALKRLYSGVQPNPSEEVVQLRTSISALLKQMKLRFVLKEWVEGILESSIGGMA